MKFNDLSIQEKAAVIKLGVGGGLRSLLEIQLFWDGMGGPDEPPTREEYFAQRAAEEQLKYYLNGSRNRKESYPLYRKYTNEEIQEARRLKEDREKGYIDNMTRIVDSYAEKNNISPVLAAIRLSNYEYSPDNTVSVNGYDVGDYKYYRNLLLKSKYDNVPTEEALPNCIATATSNNPNSGHYVTGNMSFMANPGKYGWQLTDKENIKPGGLIQLLKIHGYPIHAMIYDHSNNGDMYVNYSPGDIIHPELYKKNLKIWFSPEDALYYNFVGNHADSLRWNNDYDLLYGNGYKKGGSIHIKPENRGKFTALKKRTGHSATWFKEHGTPALKKMATFALNARKWHKHAYGGPDDPPKKRFKTPEEILAEKYGIEPMVMDNVIQLIPVVTQAMKNEYASTPLGIAEEFGTIGPAENTNAFQRKVRLIRNSDNPMWFGAYFVPYLGLGMLLSNAAERIMSGQYGQGLLDTGFAFAPYLSKTLKPFLKLTKNAFKFNINPTNVNSGVRTEYPWLNWSSTNELNPFVRNARTNIKPIYDTEGNINGWGSIDGKPIIETPKLSNIRLLKQPVDNPFVDANGNINEEAFNQYMNSYLFGELTTPPSNPFVANPSIASLIDKTGFTSMVHPSPIINGYNVPVRQHMLDVAKSAQSIPLPSGIDRQSFVTTALLHDIGEMIGRKNHGAHGVTILENEPFIKENPLGKYMLDAINNHMTQNNQQTYDLLLALRAADASRGVSYPESRLRWPSFYNYNPLRQVYDSSKETAESNLNFINRFNEYFAKYGDPNNPDAQYPLIKADNLLDTQGINQQAKDIIARHNTFIRGVRDFKYNKDVTEEAKQASYLRMKELGLDPENRTDRINFTLQYYVPETGSGRAGFSANEKYGETGIVYTSNSLGTGAGYATSKKTRNTHNGEVALVRRPYKLGDDRNLWMQEGDFVFRGNTSNLGGPYYDPKKYASTLDDEKLLRELQLEARKAWEKDPWVILMQNLLKKLRTREHELAAMRQNLITKFAPEEIKLEAYKIHEENTINDVKAMVNRINNILKNNNLEPINIPLKVSKKQYVFLKNLLSNINLWDLSKNGKGKLYSVYKKSKVTPLLMKIAGKIEHDGLLFLIRKLLYDKNLVHDENPFINAITKELMDLSDELFDLNNLYLNIYMERYKPDKTFSDLYNIPKNDELRIYSSEGIFRPDSERNIGMNNYQHYLFPGPKGEKVLDLVRWINRKEWVNNPDLDVTRGHHNVGGYPEATLKTFDLGGPIKPFSYLPIPEVRY